jgi:ribosome-associated toxin RatA of RatAB toxin-antitoxin module
MARGQGSEVSEIHRSALVPRPAAHMYDVVHDVEAYPRRFDWCERASVVQSSPKVQVARLRLRVAGMGTEFTTRNTLTRPTRIALELVEGPFTALSGAWRFQPLGEEGCKVSLDLRFELTGGMVASALAIGFQAVADRMVDDFVKAGLAS